MPFCQYHTAAFWSPRIIWKLPHSQTQVMTGFILKDEVMLLSLISLSCQVTLLYLWSYLHISVFRLKMESFPESSHFLASLNLPIWCYRKGTGIFSLNNRKVLSEFPPFPVGSSWPRWDSSWKNLSAVAPVSFERSQPRGLFPHPCAISPTFWQLDRSPARCPFHFIWDVPCTFHCPGQQHPSQRPWWKGHLKRPLPMGKTQISTTYKRSDPFSSISWNLLKMRIKFLVSKSPCCWLRCWLRRQPHCTPQGPRCISVHSIFNTIKTIQNQ